MKNVWFIGDIHGEIRLLDRLLDNVLKFNPDQLVFVGDYIDRGPYSKEVIDRILGLDLPVSCLMGNHEMMMLNSMEDMGYGNSPIELWYYNGGEATLQSFGSTSFFSFQSTMNPVYLDFFRNLKMNKVVQLNGSLQILGTHAGVSPSIPLGDQLSITDYRALNTYLLEKHIDPGDSFLWIRDGFYNGDPDLWEKYLVVHGHTPVLKLKRFISSNGNRDFFFVENDICVRKDPETGKIVSIDIDSGSFICGRLSGIGFFVEEESGSLPIVRMRSITVSYEDLFPRDLGPVPL
jgi:serine/threonine protein phosphatase 1